MSASAFHLHPQLAADTVALGQLPLCRVLLMNDARYPWLILVPQRPDLRELTHLDPSAQGVLIREIDSAARALAAVCQPDKLNIAMLGNMVSQLHVHVVARSRLDAAWPAPVFGIGNKVAYGDDALMLRMHELKAALDLE
jgi:diadenosine tetraphosphate (Ap4A) HIT family hydrolase